MCEIDGDRAVVWSETAKLARKEHRCSSCRAFIVKGEAYLTHSSCFDGAWASEKCCFACWWAREVFAASHGAAPTPAGLFESLQLCYSGMNREFWEDQDRLWRRFAAGILRRERAAARVARARAQREFEAEACA